MARQHVAANGEALACSLIVENSTLESLGIPTDQPLPKGLVGFDVDSGLAIVKLTPNAECIQIKIGKFLKKLGKPEAEVALVGNNANKLKQMAKLPLKFTSTQEEVLDVYRRGPGSCMKDCDAVRVYATDDVAVAYLEDEGKILARSVVCKNEDIGLQYVRTYGLADVLQAILEREGYSGGSLEGCRLLCIEKGDGYVMPYLDGDLNEIDVGDEFVTVTQSGEFACDTTNGYVGLQECDECQERYAPDTMPYSEYRDARMCESCFDEEHVYIDDTYYHIESDMIQQLEDGSYVLEEESCYVDERGEHHLAANCIYNNYIGEYHLREDLDL